MKSDLSLYALRQRRRAVAVGRGRQERVAFSSTVQLHPFFPSEDCCVFTNNTNAATDQKSIDWPLSSFNKSDVCTTVDEGTTPAGKGRDGTGQSCGRAQFHSLRVNESSDFHMLTSRLVPPCSIHPDRHSPLSEGHTPHTQKCASPFQLSQFRQLGK